MYHFHIQAYIINAYSSSSAFQILSLDPNKTVEEVEFPSSVGPRTPVGPPDFVGLLCEAGILSNFVQNVGWQGAIFVSLENHT